MFEPEDRIPRDEHGGGDYGAADITVLEGLEAVRKRPSMYIGSTGPRGLHHLVYEVVDNSVDEAMAGRCRDIEVTLLADGGVRVTDDGRGIPVDEHPGLGKSALEVVMTLLHAGGKFDNKSYAVSGGLHGVGISVVNALSRRLIAEVHRDGSLYRQTYQTGVPDGPVERVGETDRTGTTITFWADEAIFEDVSYSWETLANRFRETAFLSAGLRLAITDERELDPETGQPLHAEYRYEGGLRDFVTHLNASKEPLHEEILHLEASEDTDEHGSGPHELEIALQWNSGYHESVHTFANTINTHEGGTHEEGFRKALTAVINRFARELGMLSRGNGRSRGNGDKDVTITGEDVREGLTAIVSVKLADPQFEGQTKTKLGNTPVRSFVERTCHERLRIWFEEHPAETRTIVAKCLQNAQARVAARAARELTRRKGLLESTSLPGKLADCTSKDPGESELFVVEGDSAGGSSKMARDRATQAILPIRGKILNVEKARLGKILENKEIQALITAIGTGIGEEFDLAKARYHKIVMLMDADIDGAHIRTLVLTFVFRYMRELLDGGYLYIAQPPLYQMAPPGSRAKSAVRYALNEVERDAILAEWRAEGKITDNGKKPEIYRLKGLGEMDADQLWDTTMNPATRALRQVTMEDAAGADHMFTVLMGDDVGARREFIVRNAKDVRFLDV